MAEARSLAIGATGVARMPTSNAAVNRSAVEWLDDDQGANFGQDYCDHGGRDARPNCGTSDRRARRPH